MKMNNSKSIPVMAVVLIAAFVACYSITAQAQEAPPQTQPQGPSDLIEQLHLTPEQRQQVRVIREQNRIERTQINQRLREATIALQVALDSDSLDEALIEQRLKDTAAAQAALMRARVMTEVRIRRVLTMDQLATLRTLRSRAQGFVRDPNRSQRPVRRDNTIRPNQRNGMAPLFPPQNPRRPQRP